MIFCTLIFCTLLYCNICELKTDRKYAKVVVNLFFEIEIRTTYVLVVLVFAGQHQSPFTPDIPDYSQALLFTTYLASVLVAAIIQ